MPFRGQTALDLGLHGEVIEAMSLFDGELAESDCSEEINAELHVVDRVRGEDSGQRVGEPLVFDSLGR